MFIDALKVHVNLTITYLGQDLEDITKTLVLNQVGNYCLKLCLIFAQITRRTPSSDTIKTKYSCALMKSLLKV